MDCPRLCKGQLLKDISEWNVLTCLLCSHSYMRLDGKLIELESRAPNDKEQWEAKHKQHVPHHKT